MAEDFGETFLSGVLERFSATHPGVVVQACVARNPELERRLLGSELDVILSWVTSTPLPGRRDLMELPLHWIGAPSARPADDSPLPLVLMDSPCLMRQLTQEALDHAAILWRIAFTSTTLSAVWSAVRAGLGVTVRSTLGTTYAKRPDNMPPYSKTDF